MSIRFSSNTLGGVAEEFEVPSPQQQSPKYKIVSNLKKNVDCDVDIWRKVRFELLLTDVNNHNQNRQQRTGNIKRSTPSDWDFVQYNSFVVQKCRCESVWRRSSLPRLKGNSHSSLNRTDNNGWDQRLYESESYSNLCASNCLAKVKGFLPFLVPYVTYECICIVTNDRSSRQQQQSLLFYIKKVCALGCRPNLRLLDVKFIVTQELKKSVENFNTLIKDFTQKQHHYVKHKMPYEKFIQKGGPEYLSKILNPSLESEFQEWYLMKYKPNEAVFSQKLWNECNASKSSMYGGLKRHWVLYAFFPSMAAYCYHKMSEATKDTICLKLYDSTNNWKYVFPSETLTLCYNHFGMPLKGLEGERLTSQTYENQEEKELTLQQALYYPQNSSIINHLKGSIDKKTLPLNKRKTLHILERIELELKNTGNTAVFADEIALSLLHGNNNKKEISLQQNDDGGGGDDNDYDEKIECTRMEFEDSIKDLCQMGMLVDVKEKYKKCTKSLPKGTLTSVLFDKQETKILESYHIIYERFKTMTRVGDFLLTNNNNNNNNTGFTPLPCLNRLNPTQLSAVLCTLLYSQTHIVGLPGTGKTETILSIYKCYGGDDLETDRVAVVTHGGCMASALCKRGLHKAKTIHRLIHEREKDLKKREEETQGRMELLLHPEGKEKSEQTDMVEEDDSSSSSSSSSSNSSYEEDDPYGKPIRCEEVKVVIVDEFSNVSDGLASKLFSSRIFPNLEKIITAFDPYQTAPIEEGKLAINMIASVPELTPAQIKYRFPSVFSTAEKQKETTHELLSTLCLTSCYDEIGTETLSLNINLPSILSSSDEHRIIPYATTLQLTQNHRFEDNGTLSYNDSCILKKNRLGVTDLKFEKIDHSYQTLCMEQTKIYLKAIPSSSWDIQDASLELKRIHAMEAIRESTNRAFDGSIPCYQWDLHHLNANYSTPMTIEVDTTVVVGWNLIHYLEDCPFGYFIASKSFYPFNTISDDDNSSSNNNNNNNNNTRGNQLLALTNDDCQKINNLCNAIFYTYLIETDIDFVNFFKTSSTQPSYDDKTTAIMKEEPNKTKTLDNLRMYRGQKVLIRQNRVSFKIYYDQVPKELPAAYDNGDMDNVENEDTSTLFTTTTTTTTTTTKKGKTKQKKKKKKKGKGPLISRVSNGDARLFVGVVDFWSGRVTPDIVEQFVNLKRSLVTALMERKLSECCGGGGGGGGGGNEITARQVEESFVEKLLRLDTIEYKHQVAVLLDTNRWYSPDDRDLFDENNYSNRRRHTRFHQSTDVVTKKYRSKLIYDPSLITEEEFEEGGEPLDGYAKVLLSDEWIPPYMGCSFEAVQDPFLLKDNIYTTKHNTHRILILCDSERSMRNKQDRILVALDHMKFPISNIEDGWCITVNVAQGQEYDEVGFILPSYVESKGKHQTSRSSGSGRVMKYKGITSSYSKFDLSHAHVAISRAKKKFILFGDLDDFIVLASKNSDIMENRFSPLETKLRDFYQKTCIA